MSMAGVAYHDGWLTTQLDMHSANWVLSSDQWGLYKSQTVDRTTGVPASFAAYCPNNVLWGVNTGGLPSQPQYTNGWEVASILVYSSTLTAVQIGDVEKWLMARFSLGEKAADRVDCLSGTAVV